MEDVTKTVTTPLVPTTVPATLDTYWMTMNMDALVILYSKYYSKILNYIVSDIDECATANGNCDQNCHNTNGSYYCTCGSGWRLDPDGHTCNGD